MDLTQIPEMKEYLDALSSNRDLAALLSQERKSLAEADREPAGIDWADLPGADMLHQYWLEADSEQQQAQLGHISHLRALAWDTVWEMCLPDEAGSKH